MELQEGKTVFSDMTYSCDNECCQYNTNRRCIYNVARIKVRCARACYEELRQAEIEAELDYLDGCY